MGSNGYGEIAQSEDYSAEGGVPGSSQKRNAWLFAIVGIVVVLLIAGAGVFCIVYFGNKNKEPEPKPFGGLNFSYFDAYVAENYNGHFSYYRSVVKDTSCRNDYAAQNQKVFMLEDSVYIYERVFGRDIGHKLLADGDCTFEIPSIFNLTKTGVKCPDLKKYTPAGMEPPKLGKCDLISYHVKQEYQTLDLKYWVSGDRLVALEQQQLIGGIKAAEVNLYFIKFEAKNVSDSEFDIPKDILLVDLSEPVHEDNDNKQQKPPRFNFFSDIVSYDITKNLPGHESLKNQKKQFPSPLINKLHPLSSRTNSVMSKPQTVNPRRALDEIGEENIPDNYDLREVYKTKCPSISTIFNQGDCGCCWAMASATAFSDRACIATDGAVSVDMSTQRVMDCSNMSSGCDGGNPVDAWTDFTKIGAVSEECSPFFESDMKCLKGECYDPNMKIDYYYAKNAYSPFSAVNWTENMRVIQADIMKYGSVTTSFFVFTDFFDYVGGVYRRRGYPEYQGGHSVRIVGWGETDDKVPYWIVANTWGKDWGEDGFFRIIRGTNDCGIEDMVVAGEYRV